MMSKQKTRTGYKAGRNRVQPTPRKGRKPGTSRQEKPATAKSMGVSAAIRQALSPGQPGQWTSDHRAESEKFTGWNYIAIHTIAMQGAGASVQVFDDSRGGGANRMKRATLRKSLGGSLAKSYGADDATTPLPETHPLVQLLQRPSPRQSGALFRYECLMQLRLTGVCLIWNVPNRLGTPVERYVIPTGVALPRPPAADMPRGGWYVQPALATRYAQIADPQGFIENRGFAVCIGKVIPAEQVQVIRLPHPLWKDDGQSPVSAEAKWADTADSIDDARFSHLNKGADPSVAFALDKEFNPTPEELDRATKRLEQKIGGTKNAGAVLVVTGGAEVTTLTTSPKDMSYAEGFTQIRDATMAIHGVPGVAAGIEAATGREGLYAPLLQFTMLTMQPLLNILAEEDTISLAPLFGANLTVEMEAASVDDPEVQEREIQNDVTARAILVDEIRAIRGRAPLPNGAGNVIAGPAPQPAPGTAGSFLGQDVADSSSGGEFGDLGRRQWQNNRKAINDVLGEVSQGDMDAGLGVELLVMMGVQQERAQRMVEGAMPQPADIQPASLYRSLKTLKRRLKVHGLTLIIEHPKGSMRTGQSPDGDMWSRRMKAHYGYIARTESDADGDPIDVFVGPKPDAELVFIVDQIDADGNFDEHKVCLGWLTAEAAEAGYLANYPDGWKCGELTPMTIPQFKEWIKGDTSGPAAEYQGPTAKSLNGRSRINGNGDWLAEAVGHLGGK